MKVRELISTPTNNLTDLGAVIRDLRKKYGKYLKDMSDYMGVSPSFLCSIEFGKNPLNEADAAKILNFFSLECDASVKDIQKLFRRIKIRIKND